MQIFLVICGADVGSELIHYSESVTLSVLVQTVLVVCSFLNELTGNLVGHLYYFLMFKYPIDFGGQSFLSTPDIL